MQDIATILGSECVDLPFNYLGLKVGCSHRKAADWKYVIDKVRKRLENWSKLNISLGGRITMIKSVLSAIPTYALSVFRAPKVVLKKLTSLQQQFLWGGKENARKMVWVKWDKLIRPKLNGGLGVRDLECFNKALLGKWAWKAVAGGDDLWIQIILGGLGTPRLRPSDLVGPRQRRSFMRWWDDVLESLQDEKGCWFVGNLRRIVGNGNNTLFWSDVWTSDASLKSLFPRFFRKCLDQNCSVAQAGVWEGGTWIWKVGWRSGFREAETSMHSNLLSLVECRKTCANHNDYWKWEAEKSGMYSVRSSYNLLINRKCEMDQSSVEICSLLWSNAAAAKAKATAWRILFRHIATKSELRRRGVFNQSMSPSCVLCRDYEETGDHLFIVCQKVREIWSDCINWVGCHTALINSIQPNFIQFCYLSHRKARRTFLATLWVCVVWTVWKARNKIIFREGKWSKDQIVGEIKSFLWVWAKNSKAVKAPDKQFSDWNSCPWWL